MRELNLVTPILIKIRERLPLLRILLKAIIFILLLLYSGIIKSHFQNGLKRFFQATNALLILFAAGLVGLGVHEFNEIGLVPVFILHAWNLGTWLPDQSTAGMLLKALLGYDSSPSLSQAGAYLGYFILLAVLVVLKRKKRGLQNEQ